jgi:hypothetical protein
MNTKHILCSECFHDQGLKLLAEKIGIEKYDNCCNCNKTNGVKLTSEQVEFLAYRFFVIGSIIKPDYGATPLIQFNEHQKTNVEFSNTLKNDVKLFERTLGIGFFHYGPRLWMIGEIEPLKDLQNEDTRKVILERIIKEYPTVSLIKTDLFYRVRVNPCNPNNESEYDSPPQPGKGRLDSEKLPILYGSQDLEVCIHECRATVEDELYVATLKPNHKLKLLDLTELIDEDCTEFESLDLSIQMLFLAGKHSYEISKELSLVIKENGFDGIIYPSFFSLVRTGKVPFPTVYGISTRRIPQYKEIEKSSTIQNIALFGRPVEEKKVEVVNINRLGLNRIIYEYQFGPAEIK